MKELRPCGCCDGTGSVPISEEHARTLGIVRSVEAGGLPVTTTAIAERLALGEGWSRSTVNQRLCALQSWGFVRRVGRKSGNIVWSADR